MGSKRIERELKALKKDPPAGLIACDIDEDKNHWSATIKGPDDSPFAGGAFHVSVFFPIDYPFKPPKLHFRTKIFHPNINEDGRVFLRILWDEWTPVYTMSNVFQSIFSLLTEPDQEYQVVAEIAKMYETDKDEYEETARSWTEQYAKG
ncbi:hypothetical protein KFK09_006595 [Dendrobium nobile]|uniref:UBC core domain-containing protein n=1 Tax=Dendrobium nobile TaxID=94219 RepID=A0A8T3BUW9_DENNO|nr:hypothetical protein KFK09_006595 [Dendrobium nobile]